MGRIQDILTKAERDGASLRMRELASTPIAVRQLGPTATGAAFPPSLPRIEPAAWTESVEREILDQEISEQEDVPQIRTLAHVRLDRRLVSALSPDRTAAEHYRALRTRIATVEPTMALRSLLVTSAGEGEGKTMTAANLALSMGGDQSRVCLVDANVRAPQVQRLFGLPDGPGLCDVVAGEASLEEALVTLEEHNLTLLPAGRLPAQPGDLLGTMTMRRTFDVLRNQFDRVIVDAPAVMPLADVWILSPYVDRVLIVVRTGVTTKPAIHEAITALDPSKLLGLVLNDAA